MDKDSRTGKPGVFAKPQKQMYFRTIKQILSNAIFADKK